MTAAQAVDVSHLVAGGTSDEQQAALINKIAAASSMADGICRQTLAATVDNEERGDLLVEAGGWLHVPIKYFPLLQLSAIGVGPYAGLTARAPPHRG